MAVASIDKRPTGYLPSFDGWRAIAILGVLMAHDTPWVIAGHSNAAYKAYGGLGVNLFFCISGILITTRILEEESLVGFFDVKRFYIRRFFRIQPAAFAYLTVTALLITCGLIHEHWYYWFAALGMFENFTWHGVQLVPISFFSGHFWTLAVEEHFYILLSLFLLLFRRHRFIVLLGVCALRQCAYWFAMSHGLVDNVTSPRRTYWNLIVLMFPAACAVALRVPRVRAAADRLLVPWAAILWSLGAVLLHLASIHLRNPEMPLFAPSYVDVEINFLSRYAAILLIVSTMLHPRAWTTRLLELPPLRFIGKLSYSLYLWHLLFFFRVEPGTNITNPIMLALSGRPMKYVAALSVAVLSYYLVEKPMMRLGHRLAPPARPGRYDLGPEPHAAVAGTVLA